MPTWTNTPPDDLGRSGYRLIRTPPAGKLVAIVLSDNLLGTRTHFVGGRTIPCEAPTCESCASGIGWRWKGYLAILITATQETALFETTAKASAAFAEYHQRYKTTRGCLFQAQRLSAKPNGRVQIQTKPADLAKITLPASPEVDKCLCHIWNISPQQVEVRDTKPRPPFADAWIDKSRPELAPPAAAAADQGGPATDPPPKKTNSKPLPGQTTFAAISPGTSNYDE